MISETHSAILFRNGPGEKILSLCDEVWIRSHLAAIARGCKIAGDDELLVLMSSMEPTRGEATSMFDCGKYSCSDYMILIVGGGTMASRLLVVRRSLREVDYTDVNVVSDRQRSSMARLRGGSYEV